MRYGVVMREEGWRVLRWIIRQVRRILRSITPDRIFYIGGSDTLPPPLPREEETELLEKLATGDETVRSILIERNLRLVVYIAKRFDNTGINIEPLPLQ